MKIPLITRLCIGYEGYECGLPFETRCYAKRVCRCRACNKQHIKLWHRKYAAVRRARNEAREQKVEQRQVRMVCYTHSKLQWMGAGHFVRAVNAVLAGEARYVG